MERPKADATLSSMLRLLQSELQKPTTSRLYKAYFDDPTLSDLTIQLSDRTVHVHRIVLCRGSEYFAKMLTGHFQVCAVTMLLGSPPTQS